MWSIMLEKFHHTHIIDLETAIGPTAGRIAGESDTVRVTCGWENRPKYRNPNGVPRIGYSVAKAVQELKWAFTILGWSCASNHEQKKYYYDFVGHHIWFGNFYIGRGGLYKHYIYAMDLGAFLGLHKNIKNVRLDVILPLSTSIAYSFDN